MNETPGEQSSKTTADPVNKVQKPKSGKGLAALLLVLGVLVGALIGGGAAVLASRSGLLQGPPVTEMTGPALAPEPQIVTRTVEVEVPKTPRECVAAIDDLSAQLNQLSNSREALMRADLARVSGDSMAANNGFADVDRQLRQMIIAGNTESLRSAKDKCAGDRTLAPSTAPTASPSPTPEPSIEVSPSPEPTPPVSVDPSPIPSPSG